MRVLHFPDWRKGNYYFSNLPESTELLGINAVYPNYIGRFFPLSLNCFFQKCEILHLHYLYPLTGVLEEKSHKTFVYKNIVKLDLWLLTKVFRKKLVWSVHNLIAHNAKQPDVDLEISKYTANLCDAVIAYGQKAKTEIIQNYNCNADKVEVILHGNYLHNYPNIVSQTEARKHLNIPLNKTVYLFLGSISEYKGVLELTEAFQKCKTENEVLLIAGRSKEKEYLNKLKEIIANDKDIIFHEKFIADVDLQYYFNATDWVVLPFIQNLTSGSLVLAMGFKTAVIVSDSGLNKEYIGDKGAVFIETPLSKNNIIKAILQSRNENKNDFAQNSYEKVLTLNWKSIAEKVKSIYEKI